MHTVFIIFCFILLKLNSSYACSMENINNWLLPVSANIYDIERDIFFRRYTSNIEGINSVTNSEGLNGGPYLTVSYSNSEFTIAPNAQFENYEENETELSIGVTVNFRCTGGSSNTLVFIINIIDTNNNAPQFRPSDNYIYKVAPPLPPGFLVTDCVNNLIVRDIDLTTQRIDFEIEENPFFEIVADTSTTPKEFKATLRTTTFIRRISEPIVLWIKATDVDLTGDPPITSNATVRIEADTEFEFPDDLIFSQTFYIATYTVEGNIILESDIYLQQGYDASVNFSLDGDNKDVFDIDVNENRITLRVHSQLPSDLVTNQIYLILKASGEHTSGATATIIVNLPEGPNFKFEEAYYRGFIVDNSLSISNLILQENSEYPEIEINVYSEFSQYFSTSVQNNNVILSMDQLSEEIIQNNSILTLQVVAIANNRTATTVVVLEIVKDDLITPIFEKNIYNTTYDPIVGVIVENITFIQGFDDTVTMSLEGDFESYFRITQDGNVFNIITTGLPSHVLNEQRLLLTIIATKPRTVGAQAVLYIAMPEARALAFKSLTYSGILVNNSVLLETIELNIGYDEDVVFDLSGVYASYFIQSNDGNQITLSVRDPIPEGVISENNILIFTLTAEGNGTDKAITTVILEIVKQDTSTPLFSKNIYNGYYLDAVISIENIYLTQGFDEDVIFRLIGEYAQYFAISGTDNNNISITLDTTIPEELIFKEKVLLFTILAEKPFSVGANAVISVNFPTELTEPTVMRFSKNSYTGIIMNATFTIESIVLDQGFQLQTEFLLIGDHASLFSVSNVENIVTIQLHEQLPEEIIENHFMILEIEAIHPRTIKAHATIVIEIIRQLEPNIIPPVFERPYYYGEYSVEDKLQFNQTIQLREGSEENVSFELEGDNSVWFSLTPLDNGVILTLQSLIPSEILADNHQLIFTVTANVFNTTVSARSTIIIGLIKDVDEIVVLDFDKPNYIGTIDNNTLILDPILLVQGLSSDVVFTLQGELTSYFYIILNESTITIQLEDTIPDNVVSDNRIIILELVATAPQAIPAYVTIVIEVVRQEIPSSNDLLKFSEPYYIGSYDVSDGLEFNHVITLAQGNDETVHFTLVGEKSVWFGVVPTEDGVTINLTSTIPNDVLHNNRQLIFEISAGKPNSSITARSAIIITITAEENTTQILGFERNNYLGTVDNTTVNLEPIILVVGFTPDVQFSLNGELASYFYITPDESTIIIQLEDTIPDNVVPDNRIIVLELVATAPQAIPAYVTIVIEVVRQEIPSNNDLLKFSEPYYIGSYDVSDGLDFNHVITLAEGYDETVYFTLVGDKSVWFGVVPTGDGVTINLTSTIPNDVLYNNRQLIFAISAGKHSSSVTARSAIIITITAEENTTQILGFERNNYLGTVDNTTVNLEPIILVVGFTPDVQFSLNGELATLFTKRVDGATVYLILENAMPEEILSGHRVIILELEAIAPEALPSYTTIVLEVIRQNNLPVHVLKFKEAYYTGQYKENDVLEFNQTIALIDESSDAIEYTLEGDNSIWFSLEGNEDGFLVILSTPVPQNIQSENMFLVFIVTASKPDSVTARSTILISLPNASEDSNIYFDKLLYRGVVQDNIISHENIFVSGYSGADVEILGEHVNLFVVQINQGVVTVALRDTIEAVNSSFLIFEIRVPGAACVLQLDVNNQGIPALPTVRFSSESYVINVDISQTGLIGQVSATADNGESITYSLSIDNELEESLTVNDNGELHLTTSMSSGVFTFRVVATTEVTQVDGKATVILIVESGEEVSLPPLIIIEKDEESPYNNLVTLNTSQDCRYEMTNRWPVNQTWLYVDDNGLHTNAIDREHNSIAFMAVSQIQVELTLACNNEVKVRSKRSFNNVSTTSLGPYDYGTYRWILTDYISYEPRRSLVNLIVNDINDNDPIFELKDYEPIAVGYPLPEIEEIVPPRALVELTATDADIGENAALVYWSLEPSLAVSPTTGRVHVRNSSLLQPGAILRVSATDRNGVDGRTGNIDIMVRLLDFHQIAVITIQGAFLEDENSVLSNLTNALGYEVKSLRSVIMPMEYETNEHTNGSYRAAVSDGALLQLFIYGLINREPVEVSRLTSDINNIVMGNIARTVSLEDHLESREICSLPARDTGLLAATIALSILLFILIVIFAVWFFLKWRKTYNYNNFSDQNSLASRDQIPPTVKIEEPVKPRMNIEELKRSEKRLQDILDAPETSTRNDNQPDTVVDVPTPEQRMPIVIQSIDKLKDAAETSDDEDEFGETQKARRKSVVTFNENVEKIIHLEDTPSDADYEVYKF